MFNRSRAIVGLTISALFTAAFDHLVQKRYPDEHDPLHQRRLQRQQARRQSAQRRGWSNAAMSGKGARECARRRGGEDWANFKAIDRARRGLPA